MTKMTLRAIKCGEDIARSEPSSAIEGPLAVLSDWAADRAPGVLPPVGEDGYVDVPEAVAGAFLAIVEAHLARTNPPDNVALLARAMVVRLKGELPKGPEAISCPIPASPAPAAATT